MKLYLDIGAGEDSHNHAHLDIVLQHGSDLEMEDLGLRNFFQKTNKLQVYQKKIGHIMLNDPF